MYFIYLVKFAGLREPQKFKWTQLDTMYSDLHRKNFEYGEIEWMQLLEQGR